MNQDLRSYVQSGSSEAFAKIVEAHVDAVYSQCLRQLRNSALAEDITQMVFIALAKKAATIPDHIVLGGWLFKATRYCCQNVQRSEMRRRKREQKVASMRSETIQTPHAPSDADQAEGLLDDAIACLSTRDRDAILLRYFQGKSVRDLAEVLRISEDAAKQRVCRAVERLRIYFADRGVAMPSVAMVGLLDAAVKPAAPSIAKAVIVTATAKSAGAAMAKVGSSWFTLSVS
jgi:RNA polymerase sigma factor (sigma-70 family)